MKIQFESGQSNLLIHYGSWLIATGCWTECSWHSGQATGLRNAGWDFSIGGSGSTGTVRSVVRPPQVRERKPEVPLNQSAPRKTLDASNQRSSASGTMLHTASEFSTRKDANDPAKQENYLEDVWHNFPLYIVSGSCAFTINLETSYLLLISLVVRQFPNTIEFGLGWWEVGLRSWNEYRYWTCKDKLKLMTLLPPLGILQESLEKSLIVTLDLNWPFCNGLKLWVIY